MVPVDRLDDSTVDSPEDLRALAEEAERFLARSSKRIETGYLSWGFSRLAIFLYNVEEEDDHMWTWVIVGEMPPAQIEFEDCPNAFEALSAYLGELSAWIEAVRKGESTQDIMPILHHGDFSPYAATKQEATKLELRVRFIAENIVRPFRKALQGNRYVRESEFA